MLGNEVKMENPSNKSVQDWFQYELEKLIEKYKDESLLEE